MVIINNLKKESVTLKNGANELTPKKMFDARLTYKIVNKVSGYGLLAGSWGTKPDDRQVGQYPLSETGSNADGFVWNIEEHASLDCSEDLKLNPGTNPENIGDIQHLTSIDDVPKEETGHVIIGEVLIPFFAVNDQKNQSSANKVKNDPYYIFRREGYWTRVYYFLHHGKSPYEEKQTTTIGLTNETSQTMENTIGLQLEASAEVSYKGGGFGAKASLKAKVSSELKVTDAKSSKKEKISQIENTRSYGVGKQIAETIWFRTDDYSLRRLNGEVISRSIWINHKTRKTDAFEK